MGSQASSDDLGSGEQGDSPVEPRESPVPRGRAGRLWALGGIASRMAVGELAQRARRLAERGRQSVPPLLNADNARMVADRLARLRGAAMKLGQMLSMEGDDLVPPEFADALARLRAGADTMPQAHVHRAMRSVYGDAWQSRFVGFEDRPIASASIGQVHRARLADGGSVAIKIQYPGVAESIDSDVDNLASLLGLARFFPAKLDLSDTLSELKHQLRAEADYRREAEYAAIYARHVASIEGVSVPVVHPEVSTERTLVMDFVDAPSLFKWASQGASQALRDDLARRLVDLTVRELFVFGLSQTDPNLANYLYRPQQDEIVLLDFGACRPVEPEVQASYRALLGAALDDDRMAMHDAMRAAGYFGADAPDEIRMFFTDLVMTCAEMLRRPGPYDFGEADLMARVRGLVAPAARYRSQLPSPPAELMFFQRKIAGTYLMCRRLRARVDCNAVCRAVLGG